MPLCHHGFRRWCNSLVTRSGVAWIVQILHLGTHDFFTNTCTKFKKRLIATDIKMYTLIYWHNKSYIRNYIHIHNLCSNKDWWISYEFVICVIWQKDCEWLWWLMSAHKFLCQRGSILTINCKARIPDMLMATGSAYSNITRMCSVEFSILFSLNAGHAAIHYYRL